MTSAAAISCRSCVFPSREDRRLPKADRAGGTMGPGNECRDDRLVWGKSEHDGDEAAPATRRHRPRPGDRRARTAAHGGADRRDLPPRAGREDGRRAVPINTAVVPALVAETQ